MSHLRQDSKAPTFALTYQGTYITLMNKCGFPEPKARAIESVSRTSTKSQSTGSQPN